MKLTNDSYRILIGTKNFTERYYRDKTGWLKVSARGRKFRMTAEERHASMPAKRDGVLRTQTEEKGASFTNRVQYEFSATIILSSSSSSFSRARLRAVPPQRKVREHSRPFV